MKQLVFLFVGVLFSATVYAQDPSEGLSNKAYVEVRGNASATVEPNRISVTVTLSEFDTKGKILMSELEKNFSKALETAGINIKTDVVLSGQSSAADKKKGAFLYKNYIITLQTVEKVNLLFRSLNDFEIKNAVINKAWNTNQLAISDSVKVEAVKNAKKTATDLAQAIGQSISSAFQIIDNNYYQAEASNNFYRSKSINYSTDSSEDLGIDDVGFRKSTISQNVTVRFILRMK